MKVRKAVIMQCFKLIVSFNSLKVMLCIELSVSLYAISVNS